MNELQLLIELHKNQYRQGPGGDRETEKAISLANINREAALNIADIGCGTGASTLTLARLLNAKITAVDFLQDFLDILEARAQREGLAEKITPVCSSMDDLPFEKESFDVIWSEGAIYNMGFKEGVKQWKHFLKPNGIFVATEITWTTNERPRELEEHWNKEYSEIDLASAKMNILENSGYSPLAYFVLPEHCWIDNYYTPARNSFERFLDRYNHSQEACAIIEAEMREITLYEKYKAYFSYGVYIAKKISE